MCWPRSHIRLETVILVIGNGHLMLNMLNDIISTLWSIVSLQKTIVKITDPYQSIVIIMWTRKWWVVEVKMIEANFVEKKKNEEMWERTFQEKEMPWAINTRRKKMLHREKSKHTCLGKPGTKQQVPKMDLIEGKAGHWVSVIMVRCLDLLK